MIVVAASCPDALMRSNNSRPASEGEPRAETWSVSRTSNLFFVGLLLPILASEPLGFTGYLVVGHGANGKAPILLDGPQLEEPLRSTERPSSRGLPHVSQVSATYWKDRPVLLGVPPWN